MAYQFTTYAESPHFEPDFVHLSNVIWPLFMHQDPIAHKYFGKLFTDFPEWQIALLENDTFIGAANAVPFFYDQSLETLPDTGWDWALETAMQNTHTVPNTLVGLQICIAPEHQGKKLSGRFITNFRTLCQERGLKQIIIPVRPTHKHKYPLIPIESYIQWTTDEGMPFDPWLRVHVRAGGQIIKACPQALTIPGTVEQWETWTEMKFPESGSYIIPHALTPIEINCEKKSGLYIEPNVWIVHKI